MSCNHENCQCHNAEKDTQPKTLTEIAQRQLGSVLNVIGNLENTITMLVGLIETNEEMKTKLETIKECKSNEEAAAKLKEWKEQASNAAETKVEETSEATETKAEEAVEATEN